jgi:hypothetical protein
VTRARRLRRRRTDHSGGTHERARSLAAERLDGVLEPADLAWLDEHLASCEACTAIATAYETDRVALRGLRELPVEPPRDLWARTAVAIEREGQGRRAATPQTAAVRPLRPKPALGVSSGVAVIAVVVGASVISGGWLNSPATVLAPESSTPPPIAAASPAATPRSTPMAVGAGDVRWLDTTVDGTLAFNVTDIGEVCQQDHQPDCAAVSGGESTHVELTVRPKSISQSPVRNEAVVVGSDGSGNDSVVVVVLPTSGPAATPPPTVAPEPTPTDPPSSPPTATPTPDGTGTTEPTIQPTATPTPDPTPDPTEQPSATPEPTVAGTVAIASGVKVVGEAASYSPDGEWFAFTARASDGTTGPDIYVWRAGDAAAQAMTGDHSSVFSSWYDGRVIGSRAPGLDLTDEVEPESFVLDQRTGRSTPVAAAAWRPVVGPHGRWAVSWDGTVKLGADGVTPVPASGSLVLHRFTEDGDIRANGAPVTLAEDVEGDFDVRWDETGDWLAVWLGDANDPSIGRLSLYRVDRASGNLDQPKGAPHDVTARSGFSIGDGRLAWATPPGQGGERSRVQIVAWSGDRVGAVESGPVEGVVLVH